MLINQLLEIQHNSREENKMSNTPIPAGRQWTSDLVPITIRLPSCLSYKTG